MQAQRGKIAEIRQNLLGTDFGLVVRVASLFTVAVVLQ